MIGFGELSQPDQCAAPAAVLDVRSSELVDGVARAISFLARVRGAPRSLRGRRVARNYGAQRAAGVQPLATQTLALSRCSRGTPRPARNLLRSDPYPSGAFWFAR